MTERTTSGAVHDETWRQIEGLLDLLENLIEAGLEEPQFYATLLDRAVRSGAAVGGAVWTADGTDFQSIVASGTSEMPWSAEGAAARQHARFLEQARASAQPQTASPGAADPAGPVNSSPFQLLACPVVLDGRVIRIVEVCARPGASPDATGAYLDVLSAICSLAADFHRRARLRELQQTQTRADRIEQFCEQLQGRLDLRGVAYTVANEARRLLGCDRVTVAVSRRGSLRVQAISGLDTFDPRATPVRLLEQLVQRVGVVGEPLYYGTASQAVPPELESSVDEYVDQSHARALIVLPLADPEQNGEARSASVGAVVLESFASGAGGLADRATVATLGRQARLALARAVRVRTDSGRAAVGASWALVFARPVDLRRRLVAAAGRARWGAGVGAC